MQAGRGGGAALAVDGVRMEGGRYGGVALGEASEVCCERAASSHVLGVAPCSENFKTALPSLSQNEGGRGDNN